MDNGRGCRSSILALGLGVACISCGPGSGNREPGTSLMVRMDDCARTVFHDAPDVVRSDTGRLVAESTGSLEAVPWIHDRAMPFIAGVVYVGTDTVMAKTLYERRLGSIEPPRFDVRAGRYTVRIEAIGYQTTIGTVDVLTEGITSVRIPLVERPIC